MERSSDGGATWTRVFTSGSELTAASTPSATVCWIVGRSGIVLRTTDGRGFERVAFPETTDLTAFQAADGLSASVSATDGRMLQTTDGGTTWTRF